MIRITKSQPAPAVLGRRGNRHRRQLEALYDQDAAACQAPDNTLLKSRDGIYNDPDVKARLRHDQHDKCCYCETKFTATSYGDVEHFRPKAGYQQTWQGPLLKPGYYWLAYDWQNLLFSCQLCNQEYKGNYSPIGRTGIRAVSHHLDCALEQPLLLHPAQEDPAPHFTFVQDAIGFTDERGEASIRAFGLDRPELIKSRVEHLKKLFYARMVGAFKLVPPLSDREQEFLTELRLTLEQGRQVVADAKRLWREAALDTAEYAGMVRANFPHLPTH